MVVVGHGKAASGPARQASFEHNIYVYRAKFSGVIAAERIFFHAKIMNTSMIYFPSKRRAHLIEASPSAKH